MVIFDPSGAETGEPIEMKLGTGDYVGDPTPRAQKTKSVRKGGSFGGGVKCSPQACFYSSYFGSLNQKKNPAYPVRIGWALSAPKTCFGGKLIPRG